MGLSDGPTGPMVSVIWLVVLRISIGALWLRSGLLKILGKSYRKLGEPGSAVNI